jgi:hypothetical protein
VKRNAWIILLCLLLFVSIVVGVLGSLREEQIMRRTEIKIGRVSLKQAYEDYVKEGKLPKSKKPYYEMWVYTNVVRVGQAEYQSCMAGRFGERFGDGVLVLATNGVYIWTVGGQPVKTLGSDYKPRFFPPGF